MTPHEDAAMNMRKTETRGFTLLEMMIVVVLIVVTFSLLYGVTLRTMEATEYATAFNLMAAKGQRIGNAMKEDLVTAKEIFEDREDPATLRNRGVEYYNALYLTGQLPIDSTSLN